MKHQIFHFNQAMACELDLDVKDIHLLDWFVYFRGSGKMVRVMVNGEDYYWVNQNKIIEDLPILKLSISALRKRLLNLSENGIIKKTVVHSLNGKKGTFFLMAIDQKLWDLMDYDLLTESILKSNKQHQEKEVEKEENTEEGCENNRRGGTTNFSHKDNTLNINKKNNKKSSDDEFDKEFEELWNTYPKGVEKGGKKDKLRIKFITEVTKEKLKAGDVLKALRNYISFVEKKNNDNPSFKYPYKAFSRFINGAYEEYLETNFKGEEKEPAIDYYNL